ncbi:AAA family ATPase [Vibrio splendidus]|uniref:AAA family ATPase n=1 Tax=Vibrio splendidus TaxID=29497 RepID=UPI0021B19D3D|nr:AAA family ATPase [Vibrio splendidus]UWZ98806.1 AAA family ATPase [Vibrio splendidus]
MNNNTSLQQLWDEFLAEWPLERIKTMTLQEYVSTQDKTTFTYWLETKTQPLANIKGSPSPKFGIYKRNSEPKERSGMAHGAEYSWWEKLGSTEEEAFETVRSEIVRVINAARIGDLTAIDSAKLAPVYKWKIAFMYQVQSVPTIVNIFAKDKLSELTGLPKSSSYPELYRFLVNNYDTEQHANIAEYGRVCWSQLELLDNEEQPSNEPLNTSVGNTLMSPLNQILYGPPGTGKTYHTIEAAVTAAEPTFGWANRSELKEKYDQLVADKRIRFVTFHQSYGYEEFVEGLRAESDNDGNLSYVIKDGIFKSICDEAAAQKVEKPKLLSEDARIWQLSIESSGQSEVKKYCLDNDIGAIGWGHVGNMSSANRTQESDDLLASETNPNQATLRHFCNGMAIGDVVFCVSGQKTIEAIGVVSGDYEFRPGGVHMREDYCHVRPIKWLARNLKLNVYDLNGQTRLPIKTCSELTRFSVSELLTLLNKNNILLDKGVAQGAQRFVLIIDEINRGNISKIFGELITLIEPSKRAGKREALELVLSNSGKAFSVPDNLHIIGTMNTADRSLAMMDTALRRRFDFVEMMPKPELLKGAVVKGIDLEQLLSVLNQRIEILYDREHTLGHAFLLPAKALADVGEEDKAFKVLVSVFKNKIIPLLEEYFFEDWSKIRLVLADNQKNDTNLQFVQQHKPTKQDLDGLFGRNHNLDQYGQEVVKYTLAADEDDVWNNAKAYIGIYKSTEEAPTKSPESQTEANHEPV